MSDLPKLGDIPWHPPGRGKPAPAKLTPEPGQEEVARLTDVVERLTSAVEETAATLKEMADKHRRASHVTFECTEGKITAARPHYE